MRDRKGAVAGEDPHFDRTATADSGEELSHELDLFGRRLHAAFRVRGHLQTEGALHFRLTQ